MTQAFSRTNDGLGWYLPAAGEVSLYYAQRTVVNTTLERLHDYLQEQGSELTATVPLKNITEDTGLWTSSIWGAKVFHVNQKGQAREHDRSKSHYVRAVFSY